MGAGGRGAGVPVVLERRSQMRVFGLVETGGGEVVVRAVVDRIRRLGVW